MKREGHRKGEGKGVKCPGTRAGKMWANKERRGTTMYHITGRCGNASTKKEGRTFPRGKGGRERGKRSQVTNNCLAVAATSTTKVKRGQGSEKKKEEREKVSRLSFLCQPQKCARGKKKRRGEGDWMFRRPSSHKPEKPDEGGKKKKPNSPVNKTKKGNSHHTALRPKGYEEEERKKMTPFSVASQKKEGTSTSPTRRKGDGSEISRISQSPTDRSDGGGKKEGELSNYFRHESVRMRKKEKENKLLLYYFSQKREEKKREHRNPRAYHSTRGKEKKSAEGGEEGRRTLSSPRPTQSPPTTERERGGGERLSTPKTTTDLRKGGRINGGPRRTSRKHLFFLELPEGIKRRKPEDGRKAATLTYLFFE